MPKSRDGRVVFLKEGKSKVLDWQLEESKKSKKILVSLNTLSEKFVVLEYSWRRIFFKKFENINVFRKL